ncbi:MAG: IMP dehydrogenase [Candidatus Methanofastidiosia archaeon]|jgi:IMP dehydrogenase
MAKDIILHPGRTFSECTVLPGYTKRECQIPNISLRTALTDTLVLKIPFLSAAMTSVTKFDMALTLGKEGGLGVLPARLPVKEQASIIKQIKNYEMSFVEEPVTTSEKATIEDVLRLIERHGHTRIPVCDRNNTFLGIFIQEEYWKTTAAPDDTVVSVMIPRDSDQLLTCTCPDITVKEAKKLLETEEKRFLVVLDDLNRLVKLAFRKDIESIRVGAAISTYEGWKNRVTACCTAGVDLIVIDTSDAYSAFVEDIITEYRSLGIETPLCAGNVVTYEGALFLMDKGADIVKVGMSSGSICTTAHQKGVGRAPVTALIECKKAQKDYFEKTKKYIPLVMDGGVSCASDMVIALSMADAVMMGGFFNRFYEAAAEKYDENGKVTTDEPYMKWVATWGEGADRARNLDRYGHASRRTFFAEGAEGLVPYKGRLKPTLKQVILKIKASLSNAGCMNLKEFREKSIIELNSLHAAGIVKDVHNIKVKDELQ